MASIQSITGVADTAHDNDLVSISGVIREEGGELTCFNILNDNEAFNDIVKAIHDFRPAVEETEQALIDIIRHAMDIAKGIEDQIKAFDDIDLPIERGGNHFYVVLAGEREPIDPVLEKTLIKAYSDGNVDTWRALAKFITRLYENTSRYVREQLFSWLDANFDDTGTHGFNILPDGRFIGYKGCRYDGDGNIVSINQGTAVTDGVKHHGNIPNTIGSVVEMPRNQVQNDPAVGCSYGLHVGTWDYASNWAQGVVLRVAVAPEDVVSVPVDCDAQKLRTCRYTVLETTEVPMRFDTNGFCDYGFYDDEGHDDCGCGDCVECGADPDEPDVLYNCFHEVDCDCADYDDEF